MLASLAKSPASSLLAGEFFAAERMRLGAAGPPPPPPHMPIGAGAAPPPAIALPTTSQLSLAASTGPVFSLALNSDFRLDEYHSLEDIYLFVDSLARRYKSRVRVFSIGQTQEKRPIKALEIVNNATDPDYVWLDALTHAREWITATTLLYAIDHIVAGPAAGTGVARTGNVPKIFNKNYIIVPVVNPDGYAYTWSANRMWRKNRSKSTSKCIGVSCRAAGW